MIEVLFMFYFNREKHESSVKNQQYLTPEHYKS